MQNRFSHWVVVPSSFRSLRLYFLFLISIGMWVLNRDTPLLHAVTFDWSTVGWNDTAPLGPGTQSFSNFSGTGVDVDVFYSGNMWDNNSVPNIYGAGAPATVTPLQTALRWTNNRNDAPDGSGVAGTATGPSYMEITFSEPVYLDSFVVGSLSELTNRFEWGAVTAFDAGGAIVFATSFTGRTYLLDDSGVYTGDVVLTGRPLIEDNGSGTYRARGTSLQPPTNVGNNCLNDACGYDRAIFVYDATPVTRVVVEQVITQGAAFSSNRSSGQASIVFEAMAFRPASSPPIDPGSAALGNRIWHDENGNGRQEAGEPGIANVIVSLANSSGGTAQTVTDSDGRYLFSALASDTYTVTLAATNFTPGAPLSGLLQTTNPVLPGADFGNQTLPYTVTLGDGDEDLTADFGFGNDPANIVGNTGSGIIGDRVWQDSNADGAQDPDELGLAGVIVNLTTPGADGILNTGDDTVADTATTDENGRYLFTSLPTGVYGVVVDDSTLPAGYTQSGDPDHYGTTGSNDNRTTAPVLLAPGDVQLNVDFGYDPGATPLGRLGNKVWFDADASGTIETNPLAANEYGIPGVTVALLQNETGATACNPSDGTNPIIATTITDADGMYMFEDLPLDDGDGDYDYIVWVNDTNSVLAGLMQTHDFDDIVTPNCSITALDAAKTEDLDQDFSYTPSNHDTGDGLVGDLIFYDKDGSGTQDTGELGVEGVVVTLTEPGGGTQSDVTDENGRYTFGDLDPTAIYTVTIGADNFASGVLQGMAQSADPDLTLDSQSVVDLNATGPTDLAQDFGYTATAPTACLGNLVWLDPNADGSYDGPDGPDGLSGTDDDEPVIVNVTVDLYRDLDGDGLIDPGEPIWDSAVTVNGRSENGCFTTGDFGNYIFTDLPPGSYIVDITDKNGVLTGYWQSRGTNGTSNESQTDPYTLSVAADSDNLTADFGYYIDTAALGNRIWNDVDGNGVQDGGEPGLPGAPVRLVISYPNGDTITTTTTTDLSGIYRFDNLLSDEDFNGSDPPNEPSFTISVPVNPVGYTPTTFDAAGVDDKLDSDDPNGVAAQPVQGIVDVSEQPAPLDEPEQASYDFGYVLSNAGFAAVGNRVWYDENSDGRQDPGEPGIPNVTLTLTDMNGGIIAQQRTDSSGAYLFDTLPAGMYTVTVVTNSLPAGLTQTANPTLPGADFGNQTAPYKVTLADGDENLTADFGYIWNPDNVNSNDNNGVIGDTVWFDNGDGVQQPEEPGIPGVTVTLIDPGPDGAFDTPDDVTQSSVTDENGRYAFPDLPPGGYIVEVDDTTLSAGLTPSGDPDSFGVPGEATDNRTTTPIPLAPGDAYLNADFGYSATACGEIGDLVWFDANASETNAPENADEFGIGGVTIALVGDSNGNAVWDGSEAIIATTTTAADGSYLFPCLPLDDGGGDADYIVLVSDTESILAGLRQTFDADGTATPNASATALSAAAPSDLTQDFSYTPVDQLPGAGLIGDTIWFNSDGDAIQDVDEFGIEGVIVQLTDSSGVTQTTRTDENGRYVFAALDPAQTYTVTVVTDNFAAGGVLAGMQSTADPDTVLDNEHVDDLLANGPIVQDSDFGYTTLASELACIGNLLWLDPNANGLYDAGESVIGNVTVDLYRDLDGSGSIDPGDPRFTRALTNGTAADQSCFGPADEGNYLFINVPAGDYVVVVSDDSGKLNGYWQSDGSDGVTDNSQLSPYAVAVSPLSENLTADFGYYSALAALGNRVWFDDNRNGLQDPGEAGLANVVVTLTVAYPNGDTVEIEDATDASGAYTFGNLLADEDYNSDDAGAKPTYTLSVATPPGFEPTLIDAAANSRDLEDSDDPGGVTAIPLQGITDVAAVDPVTNEPIPAGFDFGFVPLSGLVSALGNYVWIDENSDGVQDSGEPGIPNVTVELRDNSGALLATRLTDSSGGYLFADLLPGTYAVRVDETTLPAGVTQTINPVRSGSDLGNQTSPYTVTLGAATENLTADFGYVWRPDDVNSGTGNATIGDLIWLDGNGNGRQEPDEVGIAGVDLSLIAPGPDLVFGSADDVVVDTLMTGATGRYAFSDVSPGAYQVRVDASNFDPGGSLENLTPIADPDEFGQPATNPDNLTTDPILAAPGDVFLNADFGYLPTRCGEIGDTVWFDASADGSSAIDPGEYGIGGVTLALLADQGTVGVLDGSDVMIATSTTAADGTYLFSCLPLDDGDGDADYLVMVTDTQNVLDGLVQTYDFDGLTSPDLSVSSLDAVNASDLAQDFSYTASGHAPGAGLIGDRVYFDQNGDGALGPNESGLEGVPVTITLPDSSQETILTDENGRYSFGGLDPNATYTITIGTTGTLAGMTNLDDPDTPGAPDDQSVVTLTPAASINLDQDFGYGVDPADAATIRNLVWFDSNASGIYDVTESAVGGVTVDLFRDLDGNGDLNPNEPLFATTTTTDTLTTTFGVNGNYQFFGLPAGDYIVNVSDKRGVLFGTWHSLGTDNTDGHSQATPHAYTVGIAEIVETADFGYFVAPSAIGNRTWDDQNGNGQQDGGEPGVGGITLTLQIEYPDGTITEYTTVSDANGAYEFGNLLLDEDARPTGPNAPVFTVSVTPPPGFVSTLTNVGDTASDSDDPTGVVVVPVKGGQDIAILPSPAAEPVYATIDFGFHSPLQIGDRIFNDLNDNGVYEPLLGESGIGGVLIELLDSAGDPVTNLATGLPITAVSNEQGFYLLTNVPSGDFIIRVAASNFDQIGDPLYGFYSSLTPGVAPDPDIDPAVDFDDNGNSNYNPAVGGIVSEPVTLRYLDEPSGEDGEDGSVPDANSNRTVDFGFFEMLTLGNRVWNDENRNAVLDAGEVGVGGVTLSLLDAAGNPVLNPGTSLPITAVSTPDGIYIFTNLYPGDYRVRIDGSNFDTNAVLEGFISTPGSVDPDDNVDSDDNGEDVADPRLTGITSLPVTVAFDNEPDGGLDGDDNDNTNFTVDFGVVEARVAVELISFTATVGTDLAVQLDWETAVEDNNFGFYLYRSGVNDFETAVQIHFEPSAFVTGDGPGAHYRHVDAVLHDGPWFYWLVSIDTSGNPDPPILAIGRRGFGGQIYLPLVLSGE